MSPPADTAHITSTDVPVTGDPAFTSGKQALQKQAEDLRASGSGGDQHFLANKPANVPRLEIGVEAISAKLRPYGQELQDAFKHQDLKALLDERKKLHDLCESRALTGKDKADAEKLLLLAEGAWEKLKAITLIQASATLDQQTFPLPGDTEHSFRTRMQFRQQSLELISKMSLNRCAGGDVLDDCSQKVPGENCMNVWEVYLEKELAFFAGKCGWVTIDQSQVRTGFVTTVPHKRMTGECSTGAYLINFDRKGDVSYDSNTLISNLKEATELTPAVFLRHIAFSQGQDRLRGEAELALQGLILPENWAQTKDASVKQDFEKLQKQEGQALTFQMADLAKKFANKEIKEDQFQDELLKMQVNWTKQFAEKAFNYVKNQKNAGRLLLDQNAANAFRELDGMYSGGDARKQQLNHWFDVIAIEGTTMALSGGIGNIAKAGAKLAIEKYIAQSLGEEALKGAAVRTGVYVATKTTEAFVFNGVSDSLQAAAGNKHAFDNFWGSGLTTTISFMGMQGSGKLAANAVFAAAEKSLPKETQVLLNSFLKGESKELFLSQVIQSNAKLRALNTTGQLTAQVLYQAIQGQAEGVISGKPVSSLLSPAEWAQALGHSALEVASLTAGRKLTKGVEDNLSRVEKHIESQTRNPLPNLTIDGQEQKPTIPASLAVPEEKKVSTKDNVQDKLAEVFGMGSSRDPSSIALKDLHEKLKDGTLTADNFPQSFLEMERVVPPSSPEGKQFQAEMEKVLQRLVPDPAFQEKLKTNPIQFILTDTGDPNAYIIPTENKTLMAFDKSIFPTFENFNQLAFVTFHELTHLKIYDLIGAGANSQIEEASADARPIAMMANLSTPEIPNGLDMREARKWMQKVIGKTEPPVWASMVDAHALPEFRDDNVENSLAVIRQLQGTKGAAENKAVVPMPDSLIAVAEHARHASFVQEQLGADFDKLSGIEQLKKIQSILPNLSDRYFIRSKDLSNIVRGLKLDAADDDQFKLASAVADNLLTNPRAFNDLCPALNRAIFNNAEYFPDGKISDIANAVDDFIQAKNSVEMLNNAKWLQETLNAIPSNEIDWRAIPLSKFDLKSTQEYSRELKQAKNSPEDVLMPWNEHVKLAIATHSSDMYRTLWSLGVLDPRLASTASEDDINWYRSKKIFGGDTSKFVSYPTSPKGDLTADQLKLDAAGALVGTGVAESTDRFSGYENLLIRRLAQISLERAREAGTKPLTNEPAEFVKNPKSFFEQVKGKLEGISLVKNDVESLQKRCQELTKVTTFFDKCLKDPSAPYYNEAREAIRSFFLNSEFSTNYEHIIESQSGYEMRRNFKSAISYLPLLDFIAQDDHKLFTIKEKGQLLAEGGTLCAEIGFWRKAFQYQKPENATDLKAVIEKYESAGYHGNDQNSRTNISVAAATEMSIYLKTHHDPKLILDLIVKHPEFVETASRGHELFEVNQEKTTNIENKVLEAVESPPNWPADPVSLYKIYQFAMDQHLLTEVRFRDEFTKRITESYAKIPDVERAAVAEKILLTRKEVPDLKVRNALISDWAKLRGQQFGTDDGSALYAKKISATIENVGRNAVFNVRYEMLRQLADAVISQRDVSLKCENSIYQRVGRSDATRAGELFGAGQSIYKTLCTDNKQESLVNLFLSSGSTEDIRQFADKNLRDLADFVDSDDPDEASLTLARIQSHRMYEDFWSAPLPLRAMIMKELLMPPSQIKSEAGREKLFGQASERCINELLPANINYSKEGRAFLQAFLAKGVLDENSRPLFLSALMAAKQSASGQGEDVGVGQRLATLLDLMGPAWKKLGQAIASHPSTPADIANDMEPLKGKIDTPRWQMWALYEATVPKELRDKYPKLGKVLGAASFFTTVDAYDSVFSMITPYAQERAEDGFNTMARFIQELSTGKYDIGKAVPQSVSQMVHSASVSAALETNGKVGAITASAMTDRYAGTTVIVNDTPYSVSSAQWYNYGPEFRQMQKMPGQVFNDAVKEAKGDPAKTSQVHDQAKAVVAIETANDTDGGPVDRDRHGRNFVVDGNKIGMFDMGATHAVIKDKDGNIVDPTNAQLVDDVLENGGTITVHTPEKAEREMLGNTLVELFKAMKDGKALPEIMHEQIEKVRSAGGDPEYLILVERGILARQDCMKLLGANSSDLHDIFAGIYQSGGRGSLINPDIRKILETRIAAGELGEAEGLASVALTVIGLTGNKGRTMLTKYLADNARNPVVISRTKVPNAPQPVYWPMPKNTNSILALSTPEQIAKKP